VAGFDRIWVPASAGFSGRLHQNAQSHYFVTRDAIEQGYETYPITAVPAADFEGSSARTYRSSHRHRSLLPSAAPAPAVSPPAAGGPAPTVAAAVLRPAPPHARPARAAGTASSNAARKSRAVCGAGRPCPNSSANAACSRSSAKSSQRSPPAAHRLNSPSTNSDGVKPRLRRLITTFASSTAAAPLVRFTPGAGRNLADPLDDLWRRRSRRDRVRPAGACRSPEIVST
jgi:hypothetical protein